MTEHEGKGHRANADPAEAIGKAGTTVKEGIVSSLKGINEIEAEIVSVVRSAVSSTLRTTGDIANETIKVTTDVTRNPMPGLTTKPAEASNAREIPTDWNKAKPRVP